MKRKVICLLLAVCMVLPFCITAYADGNDAGTSVESQIAANITQMVLSSYADVPGRYEVQSALTVYNGDTDSVYYKEGT